MTASSSGGSTCLTAKGLDISLAALQRQDPYINNIVDVASQVALYTFNNRANEWEKTDVEGTLFVYTRLASPRHGFTIQNRLSMDNLTEPITKDLDFQLQDPFLLYRNVRLAIHGIWFYDKEDCQRIATLMRNLTQQEQVLAQHGQNQAQRHVLAQHGQNQAQTQVRDQGQGGWAPRGLESGGDSKAVDILQMLTKARSEYDKGGKPSSEPKEMVSSGLYDNPNLIKPIPVKPTDRQTSLHTPAQNSEGEPLHLSLATLFGSQPPAESASPMTGPGSVSGTGSGVTRPGGVTRPAVARSLSYEDPAVAPAVGAAPPQHCPAIQKLMSGQRGILELLHESPENRLSENGAPPPPPGPQHPHHALPPPPGPQHPHHPPPDPQHPPPGPQHPHHPPPGPQHPHHPPPGPQHPHHPPPGPQHPHHAPPPPPGPLHPHHPPPGPPGPQHPPPPHARSDPIQRLFQSHSAPPCCSHPPPLLLPPPSSSLQPAPPLLATLLALPRYHQQPPRPQAPPPAAAAARPQAPPPAVSPQELLLRLQLVQREQGGLAPPQEPPRPTLAPRFHEPALLAGPGHAHTTTTQKTSLQYQALSPQSVPASVAPATLLLSPSVFSHAKAPPPGPAQPNCCPPPSAVEETRVLSKSQLQATLLDLITTDSSFLDTIYEAYVCRLGNSSATNKY